MKKLLVTLLLILAFPILFTGSKSIPLVSPIQVYACADPVQPGNCNCGADGCAEREHKKHKHLGDPKHNSDSDLPMGFEPGVGIIAFLFLLWLRMR